MTLHLNTTAGMLTLGTAPPTQVPCMFCGGGAQLLVDENGDNGVTACSPCAEAAVLDAHARLLERRDVGRTGEGTGEASDADPD